MPDDRPDPVEAWHEKRIRDLQRLSDYASTAESADDFKAEMRMHEQSLDALRSRGLLPERENLSINPSCEPVEAHGLPPDLARVLRDPLDAYREGFEAGRYMERVKAEVDARREPVEGEAGYDESAGEGVASEPRPLAKGSPLATDAPSPAAVPVEGEGEAERLREALNKIAFPDPDEAPFLDYGAAEEIAQAALSPAPEGER